MIMFGSKCNQVVEFFNNILNLLLDCIFMQSETTSQPIFHRRIINREWGEQLELA